MYKIKKLELLDHVLVAKLLFLKLEETQLL